MHFELELYPRGNPSKALEQMFWKLGGWLTGLDNKSEHQSASLWQPRKKQVRCPRLEPQRWVQRQEDTSISGKPATPNGKLPSVRTRLKSVKLSVVEQEIAHPLPGLCALSHGDVHTHVHRTKSASRGRDL